MNRARVLKPETGGSLTYTDRDFWNFFCLENLAFKILIFNCLGNVTRDIATFGKRLFGMSLHSKKHPNFDSFTFASCRRVIFSPDATVRHVYVSRDGRPNVCASIKTVNTLSAYGIIIWVAFYRSYYSFFFMLLHINIEEEKTIFKNFKWRFKHIEGSFYLSVLNAYVWTVHIIVWRINK